jgi:hypothetical protein
LVTDRIKRDFVAVCVMYEELSRPAILTVKAPEVAKLLGKRFPAKHTTSKWGVPDSAAISEFPEFR